MKQVYYIIQNNELRALSTEAVARSRPAGANQSPNREPRRARFLRFLRLLFLRAS